MLSRLYSAIMDCNINWLRSANRGYFISKKLRHCDIPGFGRIPKANCIDGYAKLIRGINWILPRRERAVRIEHNCFRVFRFPCVANRLKHTRKISDRCIRPYAVDRSVIRIRQSPFTNHKEIELLWIAKDVRRNYLMNAL